MNLTGSQQEQVVALTRELVQAKSPAGQEEEAGRVVAHWMKTLGYDEIWTDEYGSVIGKRWGSGPGKNLHFDGHIDIVAATQPDSWRHPPFEAHVTEGRIWGRGTTDMKGPLAAMICGAAFLSREAFDGTITVSASVGEEGWEGAALGAILREYPADAVVIGEPSNLTLGYAQKGRAGITLKTQGRAAHTSTPQKGLNAVYKMIEVIESVRAMPLPEDDVLGPGVTELIEIISSPYPGDTIVPDGCRVRFDRRLGPGETQTSMLEGLQEALNDIEGVSVECPDIVLSCYTGEQLRMADFHPGWITPREEELVQKALVGMRTIGLPETYLAAPYCTNGSASAGEMGLPTIIFGPSQSALAHIVDEYIEIEQLLKGTAAHMAIAQAYLG